MGSQFGGPRALGYQTNPYCKAQILTLNPPPHKSESYTGHIYRDYIGVDEDDRKDRGNYHLGLEGIDRVIQALPGNRNP